MLWTNRLSHEMESNYLFIANVAITYARIQPVEMYRYCIFHSSTYVVRIFPSFLLLLQWKNETGASVLICIEPNVVHGLVLLIRGVYYMEYIRFR
jgi:hypothetical protein